MQREGGKLGSFTQNGYRAKQWKQHEKIWSWICCSVADSSFGRDGSHSGATQQRFVPNYDCLSREIRLSHPGLWGAGSIHADRIWPWNEWQLVCMGTAASRIHQSLPDCFYCHCQGGSWAHDHAFCRTSPCAFIVSNYKQGWVGSNDSLHGDSSHLNSECRSKLSWTAIVKVSFEYMTYACCHASQHAPLSAALSEVGWGWMIVCNWTTAIWTQHVLLSCLELPLSRWVLNPWPMHVVSSSHHLNVRQYSKQDWGGVDDSVHGESSHLNTMNLFRLSHLPLLMWQCL